MAVVIALDAGTTGVRAMAVDEQATPIGARYREFPQYFPRPGWVEHDAEEIWAAVAVTLADLLRTLTQPVAWSRQATFTPAASGDRAATEAGLAGWHRAVDRAEGWAHP